MGWPHKLRLRHLEAFLDLGQSLNLTRTARALDMHQSGLSKMLIDLETDLGFQLFDRRGRGLALNDSGAAALVHMSRIRSAILAFQEEMEVLAREGRGMISIGISGASSTDALPAALPSLLEQARDIHVRITEDAADRLLASLEQGAIDLVIGPGGLSPGRNQDLVEEPLYTDGICAGVRIGHPLAERRDLGWGDLLDYPLAAWASGTPTGLALDAALAARGWKLPPTYVESNSGAVILNLVLNSDTIGFAMRRGAQGFAAREIVRILDLDFGGTGAVSMYWLNAGPERKIEATARGLVRRMAAAAPNPTRAGGAPLPR